MKTLFTRIMSIYISVFLLMGGSLTEAAQIVDQYASYPAAGCSLFMKEALAARTLQTRHAIRSHAPTVWGLLKTFFINTALAPNPSLNIMPSRPGGRLAAEGNQFKNSPKRMHRTHKTTTIIHRAMAQISKATFGRALTSDVLEEVIRQIEERENLKIVLMLASGGNNSAYLAQNETGKFVVRIHNPRRNIEPGRPPTPEQFRDRAIRTAQKMSVLPGMNWEKPHPHISRRFLQKQINGIPYSVTSYAPGEPLIDMSLKDAIRSFGGSKEWKIISPMLQLLMTVLYLEENKIYMAGELHRRNIIISAQQELAIIDFDDAYHDPSDIDKATLISIDLQHIGKAIIGYLLDHAYIEHWEHWDPLAPGTLEDCFKRELSQEGLLTETEQQAIYPLIDRLAPALRRMVASPQKGQYQSIDEAFGDIAAIYMDFLNLRRPSTDLTLPALLQALFEDDRQRHPSGRTATIMLKGGEIGGLHPEIKSQILARLEAEGFEVFSGSILHLNMARALARWHDPMRQVIQPLKIAIPEPVFQEMAQSIMSQDVNKFITTWKASHRFVGQPSTAAGLSFAKLATMLDYCLRDSSQMLLFYRGPLTPMDIQDYVKGLVGATFNPSKDSLRGSILLPALEPGKALSGVLDEMRKLYNLPDQDVRVTLNGIHTPKFSELPNEFQAMTHTDISLFIWNILSRLTRHEQESLAYTTSASSPHPLAAAA